MSIVETPEEAIVAARSVLLDVSPFWGFIAQRLQVVRVKSMPVAEVATDGRNLYVSEGFIRKLESFLRENDALATAYAFLAILHETAHVVFKHPIRRQNRHPLLWNIACDVVVHRVMRKILDEMYPSNRRSPALRKAIEIWFSEGIDEKWVKEKFPDVPDDVLRSGSAEQIYDALIKALKKRKARIKKYTIELEGGVIVIRPPSDVIPRPVEVEQLEIRVKQPTTVVLEGEEDWELPWKNEVKDVKIDHPERLTVIDKRRRKEETGIEPFGTKGKRYAGGKEERREETTETPQIPTSGERRSGGRQGEKQERQEGQEWDVNTLGGSLSEEERKLAEELREDFPSFSMDLVEPETQDEAEAVEQEIDDMVFDAWNYTMSRPDSEKFHGHIPAEIENFIKLRYRTARISWKDYLVLQLQQVKGSEIANWSYRRISSRSWALGGEVILPSPERWKRVASVVVAIDTSGSISDEEYREFAEEVLAMLRGLNLDAVIILCDCAIKKIIYVEKGMVSVEEGETRKFFGPDNLYTLIKTLGRRKGYGGTDFRPVFKWVEERRKEMSMLQRTKWPQLLIYFTDGYGDYPSKKPDYRVVWVLSREGVKEGDKHYWPPFGDVVRLE